MYEFMVDINLPLEIDEALESLIPEQRKEVEKQMQLGLILNYTLAEDRSKLWIVYYAETEEDVVEHLLKLPIFNHIEFEIFPLAFHDGVNVNIPQFSLN